MVVALSDELGLNHVFVHAVEAINDKINVIVWLNKSKHDKIVPILYRRWKRYTRYSRPEDIFSDDYFYDTCKESMESSDNDEIYIQKLKLFKN